MKDLSETEKKLALLVIREMDKNARSLKDMERGADAVLRVFREVTAPPRPRFLKGLIYRLLFPFSTPMDLERPELRDKISVLDEVPTDCPKESFVTTTSGDMALVRYTWGCTPDLAIVRIQVIVELDNGVGFDTIAGETPGPFSSQEAADQAAVTVATSWFTEYRN